MQIEQLIKQMTLEEKVGQMTQVSIDILHHGEPMKIEIPPRIDEEAFDTLVRKKMIGSILNVPSGYLPNRQEWFDLIKKIQDKAGETRLKIPVLYGIDAIHGLNYCKDATLFPQPISIAASFNLTQAEQIAEATAYECRSASMPWNFSPALDVGRNVEWPRMWESFGEDVYLNAVMGVATVKGYQGDDPSAKDRVAACLKHFTGYGIPLSGKDRTPAWIPERYLREYFLPAYEATIEAGALSIMINSGEINGIPVHASYYLLTEILRGELGFEGLLVTDWRDIIYLHTRHRIAPTMKEAVRLAVEAGVDMSMTPFNTEFTDLLIELVREGSISMDRIDTSVRRILDVKEKLGLFEEAVHEPTNYPAFGGEQFQRLSYESAAESIVLLKNEENILPLAKDAKILVCGPAADNQRALNGGWTSSWQGDMADEALANHPTILEAIKDRQGTHFFEYREGVSYEKDIDFREAIWKAQEADYIVMCLGEDSYTEDCGNLNDLHLDKGQMELALALVETGKPVILVLAEGRPRIIRQFEENVKAVLGCFYPGPRGGEALADILFGEVNPSAKMPFTYPQYSNSLVPYDHKYTEDRDVDESGLSFNPQYEFGHGLSYTSYAYSDLKLNQQDFKADEVIELSVTVKNTGKRSGKEAILVYVSDLYASITPPVKRLRAFDKIELAVGESKEVQFQINPSELSFVGQNNEWILEAVTFKVQVGPLTQEFELMV
ncbi:MAG: glycoside hydrolase family 3 N-terminal domain-containing protein [Bacteroidota bacterium]